MAPISTTTAAPASAPLAAHDLARLTALIRERHFRKIALQFPDAQLKHAAGIVLQLEDALALTVPKDCRPAFYVLADTSYGSCCVDEVAAAHADADLVVHFGPACLSATSRLPAAYVFDEEPLDVEQCAEAFTKQLPVDSRSNSLLVWCDVPYHPHANALASALSARLGDVVEIQCTRLRQHDFVKEQGNNASAMSSIDDMFGAIALPLTKDELITRNTTILYVGAGETPALTALLFNFNACRVLSYDPAAEMCREESATVNRQLMKRFLAVEKVKEAEVIGIIAGTLGVANYATVIHRLRRIIVAAGRRPYILSVGKLNPAKLANFLEIDAFVLVACPLNSLVVGDTAREFMRPIVTPYELELALAMSGRGASGVASWVQHKYSTDFEWVLKGIENISMNHGEAAVTVKPTTNATGDSGGDNTADDSDTDVPQFSMATGKLVSRGDRSISASHATDATSSRELTRTESAGQIVTMSTAPTMLAHRTWTGLELVPATSEDDPADTGVSALEEGRRGIARGYTHEIGYDEETER